MTQCSEEGCGSGTLARGMCAKHYNRWLRTGTTAGEGRKVRGTCSIEGCDKPHTAFGRCDKHYRAEYRPRPPVVHGDRACAFCASPIPERRTAKAIFCSVDCKHKDRVRSGKAQAASRRHYFKRSYGLTMQDIAALLTAQDNRCAICRTAEWGGKHNGPHVDHCHSTGVVRGLLCSECNYGLGKFRDDPAALRAAAEYVERSMS